MTQILRLFLIVILFFAIITNSTLSAPTKREIQDEKGQPESKKPDQFKSIVMKPFFAYSGIIGNFIAIYIFTI